MTEAACLLHSGAMYSLRRGFRPASGDDIFVGVKAGAFSIYFGDAPIYHFDLDGRWQRAFVGRTHFLKGLDTTVQAVDRVREGENLVLRRRPLGFAEAADLDASIRSTALDLAERLDSGLSGLDPPEGSRPLTSEQVRDLLDRVVRWDAAAWFAHRERHLAAYGPLPFLPPEAASPLVLQATLGHARGAGFGGEPPAEYCERSPVELGDHARNVVRLLGRRILQCRQVFMAGGDFLRLGPEAVIALLDAAREELPIRPANRARPRERNDLETEPGMDGFQAFLHEFDRPPWSPELWSELQVRHFGTLVLGLESGSSTVRRLYGREWADERLREWTASCPVGLGLVVVVGAGGEESTRSHVEETVALVDSLAIPPGSLVSLVDVDELDTRPAIDRPFTPLDASRMASQREELKGRLSAALAPRRIKVTTYSTGKRWK
jgi:hypothetical protein